MGSNVANILTELPHDLKVGSEVEIKNITSANNPVGTANSGFNGKFNVTGITSAREFTVSLVSSTASVRLLMIHLVEQQVAYIHSN